MKKYFYIFIALCYSDHEKFEKEIAVEEELLQLDPNHVSVYNNLANAYNNIGQNEKARELLEKAIAIDPEMVEASINLSYTEFELGNVDRALEIIFRECLAQEKKRKLTTWPLPALRWHLFSVYRQLSLMMWLK